MHHIRDFKSITHQLRNAISDAVYMAEKFDREFVPMDPIDEVLWRGNLKALIDAARPLMIRLEHIDRHSKR